MKVLVCHNFYQRPGGEDQVFADETALLEQHGDQVIRFTLHNDKVEGTGKLGLLRDTLWNRKTYAQVRDLVRQERPAVVHFHNTFPLMSPAVYYAARREGAAVVQTLHNYRLLCPNAMLFREGKVCEDCLGKTFAWPAIKHKCYRDNRAATAATAGMLAAHRVMGTYRRAVDVYIALTEFCRAKYIEGGLPAERIMVKPNFSGTDLGIGQGLGDERGPFALFVGRLDVGKGLEVVLGAWSKLPGLARLKILGDGMLAPLVKEAAARDSRIEWLGRRPSSEVYDAMGNAAFMILPSVWYEAMPKTIVEAYSRGTPILASRLGVMQDLVEAGKTGLHFAPSDENDLANQVRWAFDHPLELAQMRQTTRATFEAKYTAAQNYLLLRQCYDIAIARYDQSHPVKQAA